MDGHICTAVPVRKTPDIAQLFIHIIERFNNCTRDNFSTVTYTRRAGGEQRRIDSRSTCFLDAVSNCCHGAPVHRQPIAFLAASGRKLGSPYEDVSSALLFAPFAPPPAGPSFISQGGGGHFQLSRNCLVKQPSLRGRLIFKANCRGTGAAYIAN